MNQSEGEPQYIPESSETERTRGREISVYLFRHGQAIYESPEDFEGRLTGQGRLQAQKATEDLFKSLEDGETVVFYVSPISRAQETAEIMQENLQSLAEKNRKTIKFLAPRTKQALRDVIVKDPTFVAKLFESGEKDVVGRWFEIGEKHPEKAETPKAVSRRFINLLSRFNRLSKRLASGPKINFIGITHEEVPALLAEFSDFPDSGPVRLDNCESMRIDFNGREKSIPKLRFRNRDYQLKLE